MHTWLHWVSAVPGGAVMKLGQMLSLEGDDFLPTEVTQALSILRADADAMLAKVAGEDQAFLTTAALTVAANVFVTKYEKPNNAHGGAFVDHNSPSAGSNAPDRRIYWESTTILLKDFSDIGGASTGAAPHSTIEFQVAPLSHAFETFPASETSSQGPSAALAETSGT